MKRFRKMDMMSPADRRRTQYRSRKSLGLCARCSNPPVEGKVCCQSCLDTMAAGKQRAREQGMCLDCWTEPVVPGRRYCMVHEKRHKQAHHRRYWTRFFRNLCVVCGKKRRYGNSRLCKEHLEAKRQQKEQQRVAIVSIQKPS